MVIQASQGTIKYAVQQKYLATHHGKMETEISINEPGKLDLCLLKFMNVCKC
jgi:hypothetical protein